MTYADGRRRCYVHISEPASLAERESLAMSAPLGKKERIEAAKRRERKFALIVIAGVLVLLMVGAGVFLAPSIRKSFQPETFADITHDQAINPCVPQTASLAMHIHPELRIIIEGTEVTIPEGVGLAYNCTKAIHTHDGTGTLHIESQYRYPYAIGDFFTIWGQPFNSGQILDCKADPTHRITMTVNNIPNNEYEKYVMNDGDKIMIRCTLVR